jgi:RNA polymerase sigma factor (sigma-70 family)
LKVKKELDELSFREVLELVVSGDPDAREELFGRLASEKSEGVLLLALARKLLPRNDGLRNFVETRDLVQSALKSGWASLSEFRGNTPGEFLNWLRTILRRKVSKAIRGKRQRLERPGAGAQESPFPGRSSDLPLSKLILEEARARVRQAIAGLPEGQRVVIELRLQGLSAPEIAGKLELDPRAVRKRESRAMSQLRGILDLYGFGKP